MYNWAFCEHAAAMNLTDWSTINVQLFNSHEAGASVCSGRELSDELTEPHGASSLLTICKSWNGGHCVVPSLSCCFTPKCSSCFARTALELALLSHQANLILLPSGQSILPLLALAASLGTNGLDRTCSLSRVHTTLIFVSLFQVRGLKLSSLGLIGVI